jgi:hypothetical protein
MYWSLILEQLSQQPERRGRSISQSMMIANGDGLDQHIKRWYLVHDLLMQSLKEVRIYTLLKQEQRGLCRAILMVKQISSEVKSQQTSSQKLARSMKVIWCIRAEMRK